jgi:DNA-binding transcriptional LysR family regulator
MDWDKLRVFHSVAEVGSFTHAGETLNLSQSAVSRQISALEESLKTQLFHRHARGLILTEQGELLFRTAHEVFSKLAMTEVQITESRDHPTGPLKVTAPVAFGMMWLTPRLREFHETYPDIELTVVLYDGDLDLAMREADVALRMSPPRQPDLVQRHVMTLGYSVYASPDYLQRHGEPKSASDLDAHDLIVYGDHRFLPDVNLNWLQDVGAHADRPRKPVLRINSAFAVFRACQSGLGIAALPDYLSREVDNLVPILPKLRGPEIDVYFVYPEELRHSKRIAVFRDFLLKKISEHQTKTAPDGV